MSGAYGKVVSLANGLKREIEMITPEDPKIVITLGSGLADSFNNSRNFTLIGELDTEKLIKMSSLPSFNANGHVLKILIVKEKTSGIPLVVVCGRKHLYEIGPDDHLDKALRLMRAFVFIGVKIFIHTSAVGGINPSTPGSLILVTDHDGGENLPIGLFSGEHSVNEEMFGPQFFDCSNLYFHTIKKQVLGTSVSKGILKWHLGPQFETPAQINRLRKDGIAGVGMSMLPEAMSIQQMKLHPSGEYSDLKNLGIAVVANPAAGIGGTITHHDVKTVMEKASLKLLKFIALIVKDQRK